MDFILQPWPWYVAGPLITLTMVLLFYFGRRLGISSNLESICAMAGAGKIVDYFTFDWKKNSWNLIFILGLLVGGFIAMNYLTPDKAVDISAQTQADLTKLGFQEVGKSYLPNEIFANETIFTVKNFSILLIAGLLVGFGARYAGGCTSGHGIVGLSMLQIPSLIAIIGFFIGGILMTWFILPLIFN